jgi:hypothetical protein
MLAPKFSPGHNRQADRGKGSKEKPSLKEQKKRKDKKKEKSENTTNR